MKISTVPTIIAWMLSLSLCASSQSLFESAGSDSMANGAAQSAGGKLEYTGSVKGAVFGGRNDARDAVILGSYGQAALKLSAEKSDIGKAYAEVRLTSGKDRGEDAAAFDMREAWGSFSLKGVDVKLGRQIVVWGRADAVNPTNNVTPKNELALSSEVDDTRIGNELLQIKTKIGSTTLQGIWVPYFRPDVLPLNSSILPAGITLGAPAYPDFRAQNGGYALRWDFTAPLIDGSLSYFNGFATLPGFDCSIGMTGVTLTPKAYRMQAMGGDMSTTMGTLGLRAEIAVKIPTEDYKNKPWIPNPYGQAVIGVDRSIGNASILVQYSGLYVFDYKEVNDPVLLDPMNPYAQSFYAAAMLNAEMQRLNRKFTGTSDQLSHAITANVQYNLMHETLHLKLTGLYAVTTEEYAVCPEAGYDVADALCLTVGGRYLDGKDESLNHMVKNLMSHAYIELKYSF